MTSPNELEGAVERLKALGRYTNTALPAGLAWVREDLHTILDALASISRERDEAREENERLRDTLAEIAQARADQMAAWFKERDAMREGMNLARETIHDAANRLSGFGAHHASVHFHAIAAALVNGEGGE